MVAQRRGLGSKESEGCTVLSARAEAFTGKAVAAPIAPAPKIQSSPDENVYRANCNLSASVSVASRVRIRTEPGLPRAARPAPGLRERAAPRTRRKGAAPPAHTAGFLGAGRTSAVRVFPYAEIKRHHIESIETLPYIYSNAAISLFKRGHESVPDANTMICRNDQNRRASRLHCSQAARHRQLERLGDRARQASGEASKADGLPERRNHRL